MFDFHESRSRDGPKTFLKQFSGWVKVDAYGVQDGVYLDSQSRIRASCCWAHACRKFFEARSSHPADAAHALAMIRELYAVEERARSLSAEARHAMREREASPVLSRLYGWLTERSSAAVPKSKFGEAVRYALNQWEALVNYVQDGRLPIDNNDTERDLRRLTLGRNNWLFRGILESRVLER